MNKREYVFIFVFLIYSLTFIFLIFEMREVKETNILLERAIHDMVYTKDSNYMRDLVRNESVAELTKLNGIYSYNNDIYCVNPKFRSPGSINRTEAHEHCHYLIDQDHEHFCEPISG